VRDAEALGVAAQVRLPGACTDMPAALLLADVVVNASTDPEAFGRTVIEGQAMARLVLATDHGGAVETVEHGVTTKGTRLGAGEVCDAVPYRLRQVNAGLKFTLYCRATTATEVLAAEAAATI